MALLWPVPRLRLAAAALVLGAALAGAAIVQGLRALHVYGCGINAHSWLYFARPGSRVGSIPARLASAYSGLPQPWASC